MILPDLPTDIDTTYPDRSPGDSAHQQHHDAIHQAFKDLNVRGGVATQLAPVFGDPTGQPDGTITTLSDGTPVEVFGNSPLTRSAGLITHNPGTGTNRAGYMQATLSGKVQRIGCEFVATAGVTAAAVCLVLPLATWAGGTLGSAGVHAVFYPNGIWHVSRYNAGAETNYGSDTTVSTYGRFTDLRNGLPQSVEVVVDEDRGSLTVVGPEGRAVRMTSPYISSETANFVVWEIFNPDTTIYTSPKIRRVWADVARPSSGTGALSDVEVAKGMAAYLHPPQVSALPAVGVAQRGQVVFLQGGAGVADGLYVVAKDAAGAYAWRSLI